MFLIYLIFNGNRLPFCFLVWFWLSPRFRRGKVSLLSTFSFINSSISPFLRYHIFLVVRPFSLTCLHQVSAGPPTRKGTLLMLYYVYEWYGGAGRAGGGFVKFFPLPFLTRWVAGKVGMYVSLSGLRFFVKLGAERDYPAALYVCSLSRSWVGRETFWSCGHKVSLVKICVIL